MQAPSSRFLCLLVGLLSLSGVGPLCGQTAVDSCSHLQLGQSWHSLRQGRGGQGTAAGPAATNPSAKGTSAKQAGAKKLRARKLWKDGALTHIASLRPGQLRGKTLVVVFFTTWCPNCKDLMHQVDAELWPRLRERRDLRLLAVGREEELPTLRAWRKEAGYTLPLFADPDRRFYARFATRYVPRVYVFDPQGCLIFMADEGSAETFDGLQTALDRLLRPL